MAHSIWQRFLSRCLPATERRASRRGPSRRLGFDLLEDRVTPASSITVVTGIAGSGSLDGFLSATDGIILSTDGGAVPGTISTGTLSVVGSAIDISITAQTSITFDNVGTLALLTAGAHTAAFNANSGGINFTNTADTLSTAGGKLKLLATTSLAPGKLTSNSGEIELTGDSIDIQQTVNPGTGKVVLKPFTTTVDIDLGGADAAGVLGLTDAELGRIISGTTEVGSFAGTIGITISSAITRTPTAPNLTRSSTLALKANDPITQSAALSVANLDAEANDVVTLTNASNNVDTLVGFAGAGQSFSYTDANALVIDTIGVVSTLHADAAINIVTGGALTINQLIEGGTTVTLNAGGAVTEGANGVIDAAALRLLGTGPFTLTNVGNDLDTLAADVTEAVNFTNQDSFNVGTAGGTNGIATTNDNVTLTTVSGNITVTNTAAGADINAGAGLVALTAGSNAGEDNQIDIQASAGVTGTGGVTLTADHITIAAAINAGSETALLKPFAASTLIDLGGADAVGTLGLTDAELDFITADVIQIGSSAAGSISITDEIDMANSSQLELITGGQIVDAHVGTDITTTALGLTAGSGIGVNAPNFEIDTTVSNLEATTTTGGISLINAVVGTLTIGGVNSTLHGIVVVTSGDIAVTNNNGSIILVDNDGIETVRGGASSGNVSLTANGAASDLTSTAGGDAVTAPHGSITLTAGRDIIFGTGGNDQDVRADSSVTFDAGRDITIEGLADIASDDFGQSTGGTVQFTADRNISILNVGGNDASVVANGTAGGNVVLTAGGNSSFTVNVTTGDGVFSQSGNITINADRVVIAAGTSISATTANKNVTIQPFSPAWAINLGSTTDAGASTLELSDAELDRIFTPTLRIGDPANTGSISVTDVINPANATTLSLRTNGAILDGTASSGPDLIVNSLFLRAGTGIGSGDNINVQVTNLAAQNTLSGNVNIQNNATLNIATVDGFTGVTNSGAGNVSINVTGTLNVNANVTATGGGDILLTATDAVNVPAGVTIQSGAAVGGAITIRSNEGDVNGTDNITVDQNAQILTKGTITLDADPDGNSIGGALLIGTGSQLAGPVGAAGSIILHAAQDITLATLTATNAITVSTSGNVLDDGVDTTFIQALTISLTAGGRIGSPSQITPADVLSAATTPTSIFLAAIDYDLLAGGTLTLAQIGTGGNVQLRRVNNPIASNSFNLGGLIVGTGNQLALISSGGNFVVNNALILSGALNADLLLGTTGGNSIQINIGGSVSNNGATATTSLVASGSTAATITGPAVNDNVAEVAGTNLNLVTAGGNIGVSAGSVLEINAARLDGFTNGNSATGGNAFLTDTSNGIAVGQFNAGTGNVNLTSLGNNVPNNTSIVSVTPNDGVAEIIGNVVTLTATGPSTGATGQIGFFTASAQFFEVRASQVNASTNDSRLWISAINGSSVGSITAGNNTAIVKTVNGNLTSATVNGTADIVGNAIILIGDNGSLGTSAASPLEINTVTTLNATTNGTSSINVRDTIGGMTVTLAQTANAPINLETAGAAANLTLTQVSAVGNSVTARATGAVLGTSGGAVDVTASSLVVPAATGIAALATPLETAVSTFAASVGNGGVFVANQGALTIGTVGGVNGVTATGGAVVISAASPMTVAKNVLTPGDVTLTAQESAATGDNLTVNTGITVESTAGNVALRAGDNVFVTAGSIVKSDTGTVTLFLGFNDSDGSGGGTLAGTLQQGAAGTVLAQGGSGNDSLQVDFAGGVSLPQGLTFNGGGGTGNSLGVNDAGSNVARTYHLTSTAASRNGVAINISGVELVTVNGGNGADTFDITAAAGTAFSTLGNQPLADTSPGDTLTVDVLGATVIVQASSITPAGFGVINFTGIETLTVSGKSGPYNFPGLNANQRFVQALYLDVLKRLGSTAELDSWVSGFSSIGQAGIAKGIIRSREAYGRVVDDLYILLLNRPSDASSRTIWINNFVNGMTLEQAIAAFTTSPEFNVRANTLIGGSNADENFVAALYELLFNRTASAGEVSAWVAQLPVLGPGGVTTNFVSSAEYRGGAVRTYYGDTTLTPLPYQTFLPNLLFRTVAPSATEVSGWVDSKIDLLTIEVNFASGQEFFTNG